MTKVACTEIDNEGLVIAVSKPDFKYLSDILPNVGFNLLEFGDSETQHLLKKYFTQIFKSDCPIAFELNIKSTPVQLTAHSTSPNKALIYWNSLTKKDTSSKPVQEDWGFDEQTLQQRLNADFLKQENTIRRFTDNLPLVVFEMNLFPDGCLEVGFVNKEMQTFFPGFDREKVNADNSLLFARVHPEDKQQLYDSIKKCFDMQPLDVEYRIVEQEGVRWIKGYGRPELGRDNKKITLCCYLQDVTEQRKTQARLSLVDFVFKKTNVPIIIAREDSTFYDFNEAALELHGYTFEEMAEMRVGNLVIGYKKEDWASAYEQVWNYLKTHKTFETTVQHLKKDGTIIDVEIRANYIKYGDLELNCSFIIDITDKKKADEAIKRSNERYEYATLATHDIVWETDLINDTLYFGSNFTTVFGHETTGIEPGPNNIWRENIHPDDRQHVIDNEAKVIAGNGDQWVTEYRFKKANGEYAIVLDRGFGLKDENGKVVRLIGAMQDITEKKKIEAELKRSNERYEYATLATSDVIWETDLINDTLYISKNFSTVFGHQAGGIMPIKESVWRQYVHPDDLLNVLKSEAQVIKGDGDRWECEYRFKKADGNYAIVLDRSFAMKDEKGRVVKMIGAMQDITDKKKIEEELKRSNERYEYATRATSDVVWEADLVEKTYYLSKNFTDIFGHKSGIYEDLQLNEWSKNVHPDDLEDINQAIVNLQKSNNDRWTNEYRLKKANGEYASIIDNGFLVKDEKGNPIKLIGALNDVTLKKSEEERIKLFQTVIENTTDAIIIRDAKKLASGGLPILYVNNAFVGMTGYSFEDVKGKSLKFMNGPDTDLAERSKLRKAMDNFQPARMEVVNYKKNGEPFWANVSVFPVANTKGEFTHWVSIQRDVTIKRKAEEEKEHLINELIHNNKELKQFGYITTHNLRAPLTNLLSICRMIDLEKIEDVKSQRLIDGFKKSTMLLNETLNDLIEILIIKENRNLPTGNLSFTDILTKTITSISNTISNAGAVVETDFSKVAFINFSNTYLESIFLNLLTNSIKYAHPKRNPEIFIRTEIGKDGTTKLYFSDNGIGMDMRRVKDKIFGLYQRFHNNSDSKGIGLYLIHSQITALGGTIEVESEVNVGTTFTITFK